MSSWDTASWRTTWEVLRRHTPHLPLALLLAVTLSLVACSSNGVSPSPVPQPPAAIKVMIEEDGVYVLSQADLLAAGLDLTGVDTRRIRLSNQGRDVPILVSGEGAELAIIFRGRGNTGPYSRQNVYWLDLADDAGQRMAERSASGTSCGAPAASFLDTVRAEENLLYIGQVPAGEDHWYWQKLTAPATALLQVDLPDPAPGDGTLRLGMLGYTSDEVNPDHHVGILFNECPLGEVEWDGQQPHMAEVSVPQSCLREGQNLLQLDALADTGARVDVVLVDWLEVDYQRRFVAREDSLEFSGQGGSYVVMGFGSEPVWLFDVSDPLEPALVANATVEGETSPYTLSLCEDEQAERRYLAVGQGALRRPEGLASARDSVDLRSPDRQADYVVITHELFEDAVQPLVEWRRDQGLSVQVVTITEVYDQFSYGLVDPAAIRNLLRYAQNEWAKPAPQYVLLVGEASYDYRDYQDGPNKSLLPTYLVETAFSGQTVSDNWFVCLDEDDILPDMAIGRLPVSTVDEARTVVGKIIAYEQGAPPGDWQDRILLVADGADDDFAAQSDLLAAESVPPGYEVSRVYAGSVADPQSAVEKELSAGSLIVNYAGHGSIDTWAKDRLFSSEQISSLGNDGRQPLVILMSCLLGFFGHPERDAMAEDLLLAEDGGAVAVFASSSLTLSSDQGPLDRALVRALLTGEAPTVGQAILEAKRSLSLETQPQRDVLETFTLLGDPALRLASSR